MVERWWKELERKFPSLKIDEYYVVMPNHFHGIVFIPENCRIGSASLPAGRTHRSAPTEDSAMV